MTTMVNAQHMRRRQCILADLERHGLSGLGDLAKSDLSWTINFSLMLFGILDPSLGILAAAEMQIWKRLHILPHRNGSTIKTLGPTGVDCVILSVAVKIKEFLLLSLVSTHPSTYFAR